MKNYDVVIIGGGTAGCSCAYNCGKMGLKTIIIEKNGCLGGTMTSGLVVPVMKTGNNLINIDFYTDLISEMQKLGAQITYQDNPGWFNPELLKIVLDKMMIDANVDILFNADIDKANLSKNKILSLQVHAGYSSEILSVNTETIDTNNTFTHKDDILSVCIGAKYVVDSTGNLEFSKKINCEFLENSDEFQPMSLRFIMGGIDLKSFGQWLLSVDNNREVTTVEEIDGQVHLSTAYTWDTDKHWALANYFEEGFKNNELKKEDVNYFQVFTLAGMPNSLAFNCPRIVKNLNPNSSKDVSVALIEARQAILRIYNFCKKRFPGFENAFISNISDQIGIRASNRIKGKYIYTISDLKEGKKFKNPVLISNYPVDVHSRHKNSSTLELCGEYQLPIESLMSADFDNLFVAGRGVSADELSQGALRVQANCFAMGEGVAKYIKKHI